MGRTVWYPGHMEKGRRQLDDILSALDVVVEVRDARAPLLTAAPMMRQISMPSVLALTKSDIANHTVTYSWTDYFQAEGRQVWAFDARQKVAKGLIQALLKHKPRHRELRTAVLGVPNVGKSCVLNHIVGRRSALVGGIPGVTKSVSWYRGNGFLVVDSPGVLDPKADAEVHRKLAWIGATSARVIDAPQNLACQCIAWFQEKGMWDEVGYVWGISGNGTPQEVLHRIGIRLGRIIKGGDVDMDAAGKSFLDAIASGKLGYISFETPEGI